jgi:hypothetical protein
MWSWFGYIYKWRHRRHGVVMGLDFWLSKVKGRAEFELNFDLIRKGPWNGLWTKANYQAYERWQSICKPLLSASRWPADAASPESSPLMSPRSRHLHSNKTCHIIFRCLGAAGCQPRSSTLLNGLERDSKMERKHRLNVQLRPKLYERVYIEIWLNYFFSYRLTTH